ncbi:seryl-tRNA synthetase [Brucella ovis IntaBari-2006-46-332]|uniref:Serine--tRNA ligase n=3 Tax=Brucella TaxID=234 RepID=A0A0H3AML0_BRUO2|nr:seryl-tRNA synthetase [Brucella ovis ATCC 25840]ENR05096.1 seryl-tRNA synthetase [Brucella ovis 80/125]ENR09094.1 seryl-tRNA synthetase [Brucella ovis F8/05B]ENS97047.1 seryl-tRNA synthetase [Brucella ovis 63/96]ENT00511.1 seryl-tRNA synthetase [Brucella ovis 81/8]ENT78674.1 seryl-tRNA synthetase [Brucella ovis IntaBari-2009-88-4]ENT81510.1 seryl-tRNA synthetase [Brucella ovis IntaBari-2006-46-348]ENT84127.1 seryl-tRNA synthetase [Brucella ovis IntaBari-2010-47-268]ENT88915.1 seryl-tRNA 
MRRRHLPTLITTLPPPDLTSGIFGAEDRLASLLFNFTKWLFSMLDIKWIRENPETLDKALAKRGAAPLSSELIALDEKRREHVGKVQAAQERRNAASKEIGKAMAAKDMGTAEKLKAEVGELKDFLAHAEEDERCLSKELSDALSTIPNIPLDDVPLGKDESDNVELRRIGNPHNFSFQPKEHFELGEALGYMDFERAAKLAGARFTVLKGPLARLERALGQFMLDLHTTEHGYTEVMPPLMVRDEAVYGTGQLPKFSEDLFRTTDGRWLIPTAEVPLTNLVAEEIVDMKGLPLRFTALTPCFRSEAGSAGRDTRGMLRQHQFLKVEMVSITDAESSVAEHERMTACAEEVLKRLGLPFRTVVLCTGDMGFGAQRTYDIEVWLPGQNTYREISSCSTCGDFQGRRMNARYRPEGEKSTRFVHTLNGSGVAVGRALIAVMENYQQEDGSIHIPEALQPYMGGLTRIEKAA